MLLFKKYNEDEKFEEAWYDSSMIYYSKMVEDKDENKGNLTIVFKSGMEYLYKDVPYTDYFLVVMGGTDASQGKTLNKIIKGQYEFEKIGKANMNELNERYETLYKEQLTLLEQEQPEDCATEPSNFEKETLTEESGEG